MLQVKDVRIELGEFQPFRGFYCLYVSLNYLNLSLTDCGCRPTTKKLLKNSKENRGMGQGILFTGGKGMVPHVQSSTNNGLGCFKQLNKIFSLHKQPLF
jgi:hypothetical protein